MPIPASHSRLFHAVLLISLLGCFSLSGCVYFNTFYNAKKSFKTAEKSRKSQNNPNAKGNRQDYQNAIDKALKVVENHPNSKWYDDALYVLGVSYYYTDQYSKSERRMREILANYPNSKYSSEAHLYIAKSKLMQKEYDDAMENFEAIFRESRDKKQKSEAASALGYYYYENKRYREAEPYFLALRDSLGEGIDRVVAQQYVGDGLFELSNYSGALSAYLQILGMKPDTWQRYHALSQAAICAYRLQRIEAGIDYLTTLANDPLYFDSLGTIKLRLAEGYMRDENISGAEVAYQDIIDHEKNNMVVGQAFYQLGLIAQFDYDDLIRAKKQYDTAGILLGHGAGGGGDAFQRGTDIGKLDQFRKTYVFDSTTTQEKIDEAAATQLQLADLYWSKLNKPDSAEIAIQYLIDSITQSTLVPEAMITLSGMYKEYQADTGKADSILKEILIKYPHADDVGRAIALLGLNGTEADTGYAKHYIDKAEHFLIDEKNPDSAQFYYEEVIKRFPDSKYFDQANFTVIWIKEQYHSTGDSSIAIAYKDFIDSFPTSPYSSEARLRLNPPITVRTPTKPEKPSPNDTASVITAGPDTTEAPVDTATDYVQGHASIYIGPDGDSLELLKNPSLLEVKDTFAFPEAAWATADPLYQLYFQVKLDFSGKVEDYKLMNETDIPELNEEATKAVATTTFNIIDIPDRLRGHWVVYKYTIRRPEFLR